MARYWQTYPEGLFNYLTTGESSPWRASQRRWRQFEREPRPLRHPYLIDLLIERAVSDPELLQQLLGDLDERVLMRMLNDPQFARQFLLGYSPFSTPPIDGMIPEVPEHVDLHRRSLYWSSALLLLGHTFLEQVLNDAPYPVAVSVGYLDPVSEVDAFGIAMSVREEEIPFTILPPEPTTVAELIEGSATDLNLPILNGWNDRSGPYVVRRQPASLALHGSPGYGFASSASFVRNRDNGAALGLLGCRHVLPDPSIGAGVPVSGHSAQRVVLLEDQLDLAIVTSPIPVPTSQRPAQFWPAQWLPCRVDGLSRHTTTRVAEVTNTWGVFGDPRVPVYVDLEDPGHHGDSGAGVIDETTGGILGVYLGAITNQGPTKARSVHIQQVQNVLNVEFVE